MIDLAWNLAFFLVMVAVALIFMKFLPNLGKLLLAFPVLYAGTHWTVYPFLVILFWLAVGLTVLGFFGRFARPYQIRGKAFSLARTGSTAALALALVFALSGGAWVNELHGGNPVNAVGIDQNTQALVNDINTQLTENNTAITAEVTARKDGDKKLQDQIDAINLRLDVLTKRVDQNSVDIKALKEAKMEVEAEAAKPVAGTNRTPTATDTPTVVVAKAIGTDLGSAGWKAGEVKVGKIDWSLNPEDGYHNRFGPRIDTQAKLKKQIATSAATQAHLRRALPSSQEARALSGTGFVPVQFMKRVCFNENAILKNGLAVVVKDSLSCHEAGDVLWVYVGTDGKAYWNASVRADCANPGMKRAPTPLVNTCREGTDRAGQPKNGKPCNTPKSSTPTGTPQPSTPGTPSVPPGTTPPTSTTPPTVPPKTPPPTKTTPPTVKPSKDPNKHPCYPTPKPNCPTDRPSPAPHPTKPADPKPSNTPKPTYTTPAPPKPTAPAHTITPPPSTLRPTSPPPARPTVTETYTPECPNPDNPACG